MLNMCVYFLFSIFMYNKYQVSLESPQFGYFISFSRSLFIYVCVCARIYICVCVCMSVCTYTYMHMHYFQFQLDDCGHALCTIYFNPWYARAYTWVWRIICRGLTEFETSLNLLYKHTSIIICNLYYIKYCSALSIPLYDTPCVDEPHL